jgi:hypothetical protein
MMHERLMPAIGIALVAAIVGVLLVALAPELRPEPGQPVQARGGPTSYFVSATGSGANSGRCSAAPLASIQRAVDLAQPGDVVELAAGDYLQDVVSKRDGTPAAPITIRGPAEAVLKGGGGDRIFEIHHDYLRLQGFTIDGQWGDPNTADGYREKLLYVVGRQPRDGVTGLKVLNMAFRNGGGECLRLRYFARGNEVAGSSFVGCGVHDFKFAAGKRNGEAIYIGTAPEQRANGENPTADVDQSNSNWIHDNSFDTQGNECVDIKEGSSGNLVERNSCTGQRDPKSGGFDARGSGNIIRDNKSFGNAGAGIRLGGDTPNDGIDNQVSGNEIYDNAAGGIKLIHGPQRLCGNILRGNREGEVVGDAAAQTDPTLPCAGSAASAVQPDNQASAYPTPAPESQAPAKPAPAPESQAAPATGSYRPALDTYISSDAPETSYAESERIKVDRTPEMWALLRFELPRRAPVQRAVLRLYARESAKQGGAAHVVAGNWGAGIDWNSRPDLGAPVADLGRVKKGDWVTVDVTEALRDDGVLALAIVPQSDSVASYSAGEDGARFAPQLLVE